MDAIDKVFNNPELKDENWGFAAVAKNRPDIFTSSIKLNKHNTSKNHFNDIDRNTDKIIDQKSQKDSTLGISETTKNMTSTMEKKVEMKIVSASNPMKKVALLKSAPLKDKEKFTKNIDEDVPYLRTEAIEKYQRLEEINKAQSKDPDIVQTNINDDASAEPNPAFEPYDFDAASHKNLLGKFKYKKQ